MEVPECDHENVALTSQWGVFSRYSKSMGYLRISCLDALISVRYGFWYRNSASADGEDQDRSEYVFLGLRHFSDVRSD